MEQLVLDPPRPTLRLVVSNDHLPTTSRHRQSAELGLEARRLHRRVLEWSLAQPVERRPVDADALRVVLATRQSRHGGPLGRFRTDDIWRLLMVDVIAWCRTRRLDVPSGCADALAALVLCLDELGTLDDDSDPLDELLLALDECTGGVLDLGARPPAPGR